MPTRFELKDRSDQQLLTGARALASRERESTAQLIAYLSEIDARELYLGEGCGSLRKYCTEILHLSEDAAGNRIIVARLVQRFPVVLERLGEGAIHLSALRILAPCLTPQNHLALLDAAKHKSKEQVEEIAAAVRPRPDVPSVVRKLPDRGATGPTTNVPEAELFNQVHGEIPASTNLAITNQSEGGTLSAAPVLEVSGLQATARPGKISALSPGRYKVELTVDAETHQALRQLQELMRHQVPNGDPAKIFKRALFLLLDQVRAEKTGQGKRPRRKSREVTDLWMEKEGKGARADAPTADGPSSQVSAHEVRTSEPAGMNGQPSRHIPAEVKRSVWERDNGRCTYMGRTGKRCTSTGWLEFHHVQAYAMGGPATVDNIALRCRAHNAYESRLLFAANGKKVTRPGACSLASSPKGNHEGKHAAPDR